MHVKLRFTNFRRIKLSAADRRETTQKQQLKRQPTEGGQKTTTVAKEAGRQDPTRILNAEDPIIPEDTGNFYCFPATAIPTALIPRGPRSVWKVTVIPSVIPAGAAEIWKKYFSPEAASLIKP